MSTRTQSLIVGEITALQGVIAGQPATLRLQLRDAVSGAPVTDLVANHERLVHLIGLREDFGVYVHLHPEPTDRPGEFSAEATLPTPGMYLLFAEVARASGDQALIRTTVPVGGGATPEAIPMAPGEKTRVVGDLQITLNTEDPLRVNESVRFAFQISNVATGLPVLDLKPYLGAPAHVVILDQEAQYFAHVHGTLPATTSHVPHAKQSAHAQHNRDIGRRGHMQHREQDEHSAHGDVPAAFGPVILADHVFTQPGIYKLWMEFQTQSEQIIVADFVVKVE